MKVFNAFHPYLTYTNCQKLFIGPNGEPSFEGWGESLENIEDRDDLLDLWELGKDAFDALGDLPKKEDFTELSDYYRVSIRTLRLTIAQSIIEREIEENSINDDDRQFNRDIDDWSDGTVAELAVQMWQWLPQQGELSRRIRISLLFSCLKSIDAVVMAMCIGGDGAVSSAIAAAKSLANFEAFVWGDDSLAIMRSKLAANSAMARHKKDPKQKEKTLVRECWADWQSRPEIYKGKADFARAMLDKCEHLTSQKRIEDWCRMWEREQIVSMLAR